jgi:hypothetical protein
LDPGPALNRGHAPDHVRPVGHAKDEYSRRSGTQREEKRVAVPRTLPSAVDGGPEPAAPLH